MQWSNWPVRFEVPLKNALEETPGELEEAIYEYLDIHGVDDASVVLRRIHNDEGHTVAFLCMCSNVGTSIMVRRAVGRMRQWTAT